MLYNGVLVSAVQQHEYANMSTCTRISLPLEPPFPHPTRLVITAEGNGDTPQSSFSAQQLPTNVCFPASKVDAWYPW